VALRSSIGRNRELVRRALYGLSAARRVANKVVGGKPLTDALKAEKANLEAHKRARKRRLAVDDAIEAARQVYGRTLGWYLGPNENHCPVCVDANGNNFRPRNPPSIGLPGAAHPHCDCSAGAPFPNGRMLN